jgi:hypothetical protein
MKDLDEFTRAYLECALWSSLDSEGELLDPRFGVEDFSPGAIEQAENDCVRFQAENAADLLFANYGHPEYSDDSLAGQDFWLTRCGHGAGFWDGDLPEPIGETLTKASKAFGEAYVEEHKGVLFLY